MAFPSVNVLVRRMCSLEAWIWICGLAILAAMDPYSDKHFTIFLPDFLFDIKSPGYGLGHSISFLFRGELRQSLEAHYLGPIAVSIIVYRVLHLFSGSPCHQVPSKNLDHMEG